MRLYLSSYRVPVLEALTELTGKPPAKTKLGLITNAKDYYAERARWFKVRDVTEYFAALGFRVTEVDLRRFRSAAKLRAELEKYDLLWAMGGNTFCLREEMQKSGFDEAVGGLLDAGKVYGGDSAGAIVAGRTLRGTELADEPGFAATTVWQGLLLIENVIVPHVGSKIELSGIAEMQAMHQDDPTLIELTDYQALVVNGDQQKIVTAESEA